MSHHELQFLETSIVIKKKKIQANHKDQKKHLIVLFDCILRMLDISDYYIRN